MSHETSHDWHKAHNRRINRMAAEMVKLYRLDFRMPQSAEYEALRAKYLWAEHEKAEHDKFDPPFYGDHRNG